MTIMFSRSTRGFYDAADHGATVPSDAVAIDEDDHAALLAGQAAGRCIVSDETGRPVLADPLPPTVEQIIAGMTEHVQSHLDATARVCGYDGILSLCSYATSTVAKFASEAQAGIQWRDAVWSTCYEILDAVNLGTRPAPTSEELIAELPAMVWPA